MRFAMVAACEGNISNVLYHLVRSDNHCAAWKRNKRSILYRACPCTCSQFPELVNGCVTDGIRLGG